MLKILLIFVHNFKMKNMYKNGQSAACNLSNNQIQVLLTGKFGDGCLITPNKLKVNYNYLYSTNGIKKGYLEYKKTLLCDLVSSNIREAVNQGYKQNIIYSFISKQCLEITNLALMSLQDSLNLMDELGLALWFYDDGSLHKTKLFYNLNTQKYPKEIQENVFVPFLKERFNITAIPTIERKKDGREFWYLRIRKYEGAFIISNILSKYYVEDYKYKIICSETSQKWCKLQEELKSTGIDINDLHPRTLTSKMDKMSI